MNITARFFIVIISSVLAFFAASITYHWAPIVYLHELGHSFSEGLWAGRVYGDFFYAYGFAQGMAGAGVAGFAVFAAVAWRIKPLAFYLIGCEVFQLVNWEHGLKGGDIEKPEFWTQVFWINVLALVIIAFRCRKTLPAYLGFTSSEKEKTSKGHRPASVSHSAQPKMTYSSATKAPCKVTSPYRRDLPQSRPHTGPSSLKRGL